MAGERPVIVSVPHAPRANGHYSHAVMHGGVVYVSGQLGRGPLHSDLEAGDIEAQTRRAFASLALILTASGSDLQSVIKLNLYVSDVSLWPVVDGVCAQVLGAHRPARSIVPAGTLHFGAMIEIDAIAAIP